MPTEAVLGYAETLWPEYRKKIKKHVPSPLSPAGAIAAVGQASRASPIPRPNLRCIIGGGYGQQDRELFKEFLKSTATGTPRPR